MRIVLLRLKHILTKMHMQPERLNFYSHFTLKIIFGDLCDRKNTQKNNNCFIQVTSHLFLVEFSKNVTF